MQISQSLLSLLKCPESDEPILQGDNALVSNQSGRNYPLINHIPWLIEQPLKMLWEWKDQYSYLLKFLDEESEKIKKVLRNPLNPKAEKRLRKLLQAKVEQKKILADLLSPIAANDLGGKELHIAMGTQLPKAQNLTSYYVNIHRDWAWGTSENDACLKCIEGILKDYHGSIGNTVVLGAGACRLAYDFHNKFQPELTVATDFNPLMLLSAQKVLRGNSLKLYEFPIAPKDGNSFSVLQKCKAPQKIGDNFHLLFADALNMPIRDQSMDLVLTPWLIDIIPEEPRTFFKRINQMLKLDGIWINFGSYVFEQFPLSYQYSLEEIFEIIEESGFELETHSLEKIPYMQSPYSNHGRIETVLTFRARKTSNIAVDKYVKSIPKWLQDPTIPVPLNDKFLALQTIHGITKDVVDLINGTDGLKTMADGFATKYGLSVNEALQSLRKVIEKLDRDPH